MLSAARSLTEPPGLKYSALAQISTPGYSAETFSRRTSGVLPMVASRGSASVRARYGIGRTCAITTLLDSLDPLKVAEADSLVLYHHPKADGDSGIGEASQGGRPRSQVCAEVTRRRQRLSFAAASAPGGPGNRG